MVVTLLGQQYNVGEKDTRHIFLKKKSERT